MGHDIAEARFTRVLDRVYEAAVSSDAWPLVLEELASIFSGTFVDIFTRSHDRTAFSGLAHGMDRRDYDDNFLGFWFKRNVWGNAKPVKVAGEVLSTRQMVDLDELRRSEIFNDYLDPRGLHEGLRLSLWVGERELQDISILRPWSGGAFGPAEVALGHALLPHLQRAAAVTRRLRESDFRLDVGASGVGSGDVAVVVFDAAGAPLWFNPAAEALFAQGSVLSMTGGRLTCGTSDATRRLDRAVATACGRSGRLRQGGTVALPRAAGTGSVNVIVLPMSNPGDWATARPPAAMALLREPASRVLSRDGLRDVFGLTEAEAALAQDLFAGRSLRHVAEGSGRSLNTVRSHLARLMDKTSTHKQAELVRLLGDVAALGATRVRDGASIMPRFNPPS